MHATSPTEPRTFTSGITYRRRPLGYRMGKLVLVVLALFAADGGALCFVDAALAKSGSDLPCNELCRWWMSQGDPGPQTIQSVPAGSPTIQATPSRTATGKRAPRSALVHQTPPEQKHRLVRADVKHPQLKRALSAASIDHPAPVAAVAKRPEVAMPTPAQPVPSAVESVSLLQKPKMPVEPLRSPPPDLAPQQPIAPLKKAALAQADHPMTLPDQSEPASPEPTHADRAAIASIPAGETLEPDRSAPVPLPTEPAKPASIANSLLGATTVLLKVAPNVLTMDDLDGRRIATIEPDESRREAVAVAFRSLSLHPELSALPADEAELDLQTGKIAAIATLADDTTASRAPESVLRIRIDPYILRRPR